jgi:hypothetical protein
MKIVHLKSILQKQVAKGGLLNLQIEYFDFLHFPLFVFFSLR